MISPRRLLLTVAVGTVLLLPVSAASQAPADEPTALWAALAQPTFDAQTVASVSNLTLSRDLARLTLHEGTLGFAHQVNGRVLMAAFRGRGVFSLSPELPLEVQQLKFHTGQGALEIAFTEAVFMFSDSTFEEVAEQVEFSGGVAAGLQKLYHDRNKKLTHFGLSWEPRLLHAALSKNPEPYAFFHAELKTDKHGWLLFDLDNAELEEVQLAQWDEKLRFINIWCRFPAAGRDPVEVFQNPDARDAYRIQGYKLDIQVDKKARLEGTAEVKLSVWIPGQRVLLFSLTPNLQVSSVTDTMGNPLTFFQPEDPKDRRYFGDFLAVVLPAATTADQEVTLRFAYGGKRVVTKEGLGVFFVRSFGWYPSYGLGKLTLHNPEFVQRSDFDLTLRVPKKYDAVAVGNKTEEYKEGDYKISRWVTDIPVAVCGFSFGRFYISEKKFDDDTKVQVFVSRQPDNSLSFGLTGDPILESVNPARLRGTIADEVKNSLTVFETYFGRYPYKKLAVTNIPRSYGQGWPGLLYVSSLTFLDSIQRHVLLGLTPSEHLNLTDRFRAHETSHQWWGHVVGWKSYHDQWLSEGFAEYSGLLYVLYRRGRKEFLNGVRQGRDQLLNKDREGTVYEEIGPIYAGQRLISSRHPGGYNTIVYTKGSWVLHMLRMLLYDFRAPEPDARFIQMMQDFTKTYYNQAASTQDFQRIAEKHMTKTMDVDGNGKLDWFFNQWVYSTGIPHYEVSYQISPGSKGSHLSVTIKQSNVPDSFVMPVPIYVHQGDKSMRLGLLTVLAPEGHFETDLPFTIDKVTINEWQDVLCRVDYK